ncbi:LytTR family transcriptional regulator [Natranaerovirga pectinivora]|uniref:LytTR family transcriptional regulator n=1 Tax=Natranaerovirga pectinivora TaxID=682400 RepID=A0A4V2V0H0_9FIRM|nr:LytTR family transcriptional regulator DNA-binding domain-containing protein [Natranaerovirga pectinivora]TCT16087.1 LytTR family transcriptional regulator [Natranaerovirga pectinivora]
MLEIKNLYKDLISNSINGVTFELSKGDIGSIECSNEISDMLINLIIGRELPAKGEIHIDQIKNTDYIKKGFNNLGIVLREEGFYDGLTVEGYLKFFQELLGSKVDCKDILMRLGLLDVGSIKVKKLTYQQKKRLSIARERLKDLKILLVQEPIMNMDKDSVKIVLENIQELSDAGVTVICTSISYKDALFIGGRVFTLDDKGFVEIITDPEKVEVENIKEDVVEEGNDKALEKPIYKVEKIPAKVEDKILLFDPTEIDYIESENSISHLNIRGEKFPSSFSLGELEDRLKYFGFFRCHRSYLVNLQRVREIVTWTRNSFSLSLDNKKKTSIPLSKGRLDELKSILNL